MRPLYLPSRPSCTVKRRSPGNGAGHFVYLAGTRLYTPVLPPVLHAGTAAPCFLPTRAVIIVAFLVHSYCSREGGRPWKIPANTRTNRCCFPRRFASTRSATGLTHAIQEAIRNGGPWPSIEDYLGDTTEPVRSELRKELLAVEAFRRQQQAAGGDPIRRLKVLPETAFGSLGNPSPGKLTTRPRPSKRNRQRRQLSGILAALADTGSNGSWGKAASASSTSPTTSSCSGLWPSRCRIQASSVQPRRCRSLPDRGPHRRQSRSPEHRAGLSMSAARERVSRATSSPSTSTAPTWPRGSSSPGCRCTKPWNWWRRWPRHCTTPTSKGWSTGTSSRATSCSTRAASRSWPISGWPCGSRTWARRSRYAGTPAYMSPGTGPWRRASGGWPQRHFQPGRGLLRIAGRAPPFRAESQAELLEQITTFEPVRLRQMDDDDSEGTGTHLPARPCRNGPRNGTRRPRIWPTTCGTFLAEQGVARSRPSTAPSAQEALSCSTTIKPVAPTRLRRTPTPDHQPIKIVPKGLRSFDAQDADFFLELLPGPRDREGLPDSIRFWKTRIEETDPDKTFSVGLIYGPSGCGKSSLVKAGLLPRLSQRCDRRLCRGHRRGNGDAGSCTACGSDCPGLGRQPGSEGDAGGIAAGTGHPAWARRC